MNSKITHSIIFAISMLIITTVFQSCKKENLTDLSCQQSLTGILHFDSEEGFFEQSKKLINMSETERISWEQQQGFKSYETKCNEICDDLNSIDFKSEQEIIDFVNAHSDYLYIYDENGEKVIERHLETSSYKYLINENQIVTIGDNAVKSFDEGVVFANIEKIDVLLALKDYESSKNISDLTAIPSSLEIISETVEYPNTKGDPVVTLCNTPYEKSRRATLGRDRNTIQLLRQIVYLDHGFYSHEVFVYDKPQRSTLGIWFPARRTIFFNINCEYRFRNQNYTGSSFVNEVLAYSIRRDILANPVPGIVNLSLLSFSGKAYTRDTPTIYIDLR